MSRWATCCHAGGRDFDSRGTITQGLKITEEKVPPLQLHLHLVRLSTDFFYQYSSHNKCVFSSSSFKIPREWLKRKNHWSSWQESILTKHDYDKYWDFFFVYVQGIVERTLSVAIPAVIPRVTTRSRPLKVSIMHQSIPAVPIPPPGLTPGH